VARYQSMISGLIYAACGDLHRSEDLAQETFLAAWKRLSELRDPAKMPAWLCKIARNQAHDQFRKAARETANLGRLHDDPLETKKVSQPEQDLLDKEQSQLLWQTLSAIAQPYRETLVLYYRQDQSTAEVAAALEITETAVRQRLARGRQMLREQMETFVEHNLSRSAPGSTFMTAVMVSLPAAAVPSAAAASATTVAKAAAAKANASFWLTVWTAPLAGLLGGFAGSWVAIRTTEKPRAKKFIIRSMILFWSFFLCWMVIQIALSMARNAWHWRDTTFATVEVGYWWLYAMICVTFVVVVHRRLAKFLREDGITSAP
jgi:zinc protease